MTKEYSKEELERKLLEKNLEDFYLVTIENRQQLLTEEEYDAIVKNGAIVGDNVDEVEDLIDKVKNDKRMKGYTDDFLRAMYSWASIRHLAIVTMIDDEVYDIGNIQFIDLKRNKIVHFDRFTDFYSKDNARLKYFTPEEEPHLTEKTLLMDVDDESIIMAYEDAYVKQGDSNDLTREFFDEIKEKANQKIKENK